MSDLQQYENQNLDATPPQQQFAPITQGIVDLQGWAQELEAAHQLGAALCKTDFVPKDFKGNPPAAAAAILAGKSLGLNPMNALSNIFVIHGRPALYARTMAAIVMQHGHELIRKDASPQAVTVMARRKGQDQWQEFTWTIERAKQAGYTSNRLYQTDPVAMLTAKAQAEACRTIAPDVLTGVAEYSVEDRQLDDFQDTPARTSRVSKPIEAPTVDETPEQEFEPVTGEQWSTLLAEGFAVGLGPAQVGALAADVIGHDLRGPQDIPADQYDNIMANIQQPQEEGAN